MPTPAGIPELQKHPTDSVALRTRPVASRRHRHYTGSKTKASASREVGKFCCHTFPLARSYHLYGDAFSFVELPVSSCRFIQYCDHLDRLYVPDPHVECTLSTGTGAWCLPTARKFVGRYRSQTHHSVDPLTLYLSPYRPTYAPALLSLRPWACNKRNLFAALDCAYRRCTDFILTTRPPEASQAQRQVPYLCAWRTGRTVPLHRLSALASTDDLPYHTPVFFRHGNLSRSV